MRASTKPQNSGQQQPMYQQTAGAEESMHSKPLHRRGMYDERRLEDIYRRRVDRLAEGPPNKFSRRVQVLTYSLMFGVGAYMVLYQDYGDRKHCFSGLRRWYFSKVNSWWTLSSEEEKELRERGQIK
ncbi:hypothetical protein GGI25_005989 [Coemansia spiralis]|uniref:Uncharacterized protein n=2 Tax=Coemansia TaxID=4863 RepID=A0A9W8G2Y2_9FUNG|nr:hypothetical protein BX070DRAFT_226937 [Coemansia spiralis]KAJ1986081.1 hypothetical protein EDC05_006425 [Coemansia umbellata]KAJ2618628.1 hypothetical protein GGI26_006461 [Coemansia sp. RSA 1358]KAJ2669991.1 hypothetical protein GGI25_005989 [Coemansia spiralis]